MSNTVFAVSSTAELYDALNAAAGGDVIELASGQYDAVKLRDYKNLDITFDAPVTLRSADADAPARITEMTVNGASNLTFENLVFDYQFSEGDTWRTNPFAVIACTDVTFRDCLFDGDTGFGDADETDGYPSAHGLTITASAGVTVETSEFTGFARGIKAGSGQDTAILNNEFHGQRMDNIVFGAEVQGVLIADNYMHDHFVAPDSADHRDMIQFWTDGGKVATSDVTITRNVMVLGDSDHLTQSIFLGNGAVVKQGGGEAMYYRDFTITENVIVNGHKNGIRLDYADGVTIANNTLLREDVVRDDNAIYAPVITVEPLSRNVTIRDNVVSDVIGPKDQPDWQVDGNVLVQDGDRLAPNHYDTLFINPVAGMRSDLANIQALPDSVIAQTGAGATRLAYDATPDTLTALAHVRQEAQDWTDFSFDAGFSAGPDGDPGPGTTYEWDFGDGLSATGKVVTHTYVKSGCYDVTLRVTTADGEVATSITRAEVGTPEMLLLDTAADQMIFHDGDSAMDIDASAFDPDGVGAAETHEAVLFDEDTSHRIEHGALTDLAGAHDFQIDLTLGGSDWAAGSGEVLRVQGGFVLAVKNSGAVSFRLSTEDSDTVSLISDRALTDGAWNAVSLRFDGSEGSLEMLIDGDLAGSTDVGNALPHHLDPILSLGSKYNIDAFTGALGSLEIHTNASAYTKLGTPQVAPPFDGFDLADEMDDPDGIVDLRGDTEWQPEEEILRFDGDRDYVVLDDVPGGAVSSQITVELDYHRDEADGDYARLAWLHKRIGLEAVDDGLSLRVRTADGDFKRFMVKDLGLNDTDWHRVRLSIDEHADTIVLAVDDEIVFTETETDVMLNDPNLDKVWDWRLGGAWGGFLDGEIGHFQMSDKVPQDDMQELVVPDLIGDPVTPLFADVLAV